MSVTLWAETAVERKVRGGFYTPPAVAEYLVEWAIRHETRSVLEPSAGDGAFLTAASARLTQLGGHRELVGVELLASEADIAQAAAAERGLTPRMVVGDFFDQDSVTLGRFDAIIGNPPWIRYHAFRGDQRAKARTRAAALGVELTGLASSWAAFVVHACALLAPEGRLAMVVPAELLHADYAVGVRHLLQQRFRSLRLVAFDHHVFSDAQVDALLLMASTDGPQGLHFNRISSMDELWSHVPSRRRPLSRWANGLADDRALDVIGALIESRRFVRLGELGAVDIGVVTGSNDYFVVSDQQARAFALPADALLPIVTRSDQLITGRVTREELDEWRVAGRRIWLMALPRDSEGPPEAYRQEGERLNVPGRYKCRTRTPWWSVPLKPRPDLFLSYMAHNAPRLAANFAGALSTNLLHGVYLKDPALAANLAGAWANAATELSCELEGRAYGGGVLKLETKEAERVLVPNPILQEATLDDEEKGVIEEALSQLRQNRLRRGRRTAR